MMITIVCNYFVGCDTTNKPIEEIKESQNITFTKIAYASKDRVILYGSIGLIVYDIVNQQIYRALNLKSIHMNLI